MASVFEKLTEEDLELMTDEEREGYEQELDAYTNGGGEGADGGEGGEEGADTNADADAGDDEGQNVNLDQELDKQEQLAAAQPELGQELGGDGADPEIDADAELKQFTALPDLGTQREKIKEQQELKQELAEKFDNGDITAQEKAAQERAIDGELYTLQSDLMRREHKVEQAKESWLDKIVPDFLSENPEYVAVGLKKVLNQHVMDLQRGDFASNPFHPNILKLAQKKMVEEFPDTFKAEPEAKVPGKKPTAAAPKREMPPSLRNVPAAAAEDIGGDGSEFAHLDRLSEKDFEKYEDALAKLSPADLDRYMNA